MGPSPLLLNVCKTHKGLPWWLSGKESSWQCKRCKFDSWRRKWQPPSSILAWEIPRTEESSRLLSMGSQRVRHNLATKQQKSSNSREETAVPVAPGSLAPWGMGGLVTRLTPGYGSIPSCRKLTCFFLPEAEYPRWGVPFQPQSCRWVLLGTGALCRMHWGAHYSNMPGGKPFAKQASCL